MTAAIQSYHLQRNEGNNTGATADVWLTLTGWSPLSTLLDFETSNLIVPGTTYKVKV